MAASPDDVKVDIFMPWFIQDYERDTADLSFEEHGFYGALLRALWSNGGKLQVADRARLARVLRTDLVTLERLWYVAERFTHPNDDGTVSQKRLTVELGKAKQNKVAAVTRASAGGRARASRGASSTAPSTAQLELGACTSPSPSPSPTDQEISLADARDGRLWSAETWLRRFKIAWAKYRPETDKASLFYGDRGDTSGCTSLDEQLAELPEEHRLAAQGRADEMFKRFMSSTDARTVERGHPFCFFAQAFGSLRIPIFPIGGRAPPRDARVGWKPAEVEERTSGEVSL